MRGKSRASKSWVARTCLVSMPALSELSKGVSWKSVSVQTSKILEESQKQQWNTLSNGKLKTIQSPEIFLSLYHSDLSSHPKWKPFLLLFTEMALVWPSRDSYTYHKFAKSCFPRTPFSLPVKVLVGSCHYTQLQHKGHRNSTDTCWNSQFLPWSLVWPSLLLPNP